MTHDAKMGLLVGFCFLIIIGLLISEAYHASVELPAANLAIAGSTAHQGASSPESGAPTVTFLTPQDFQPRQTVLTHDDLTPAHSPVQLGSTQSGVQQPPVPPTNTTSAQQSITQQSQPSQLPQPLQTQTPSQSTDPLDSLLRTASDNGQPLVRLDRDGHPLPDVGPAPAIHQPTQIPPPPTQVSQVPPPPTPSIAAGRQYVAQAGDSVSKMALHFLGANTKTTRNLIIQANPALQQNPDWVVVGQAYVIPAAPATASTPTTPSAPSAPAGSPAPIASGPAPSAPAPAPAVATDTHYVVQAGDNLWKIARDQLGDPQQVDAIKQLNSDVLRGDNHDVVLPGMALTLPPRTVASAH